MTETRAIQFPEVNDSVKNIITEPSEKQVEITKVFNEVENLFKKVKLRKYISRESNTQRQTPFPITPGHVPTLDTSFRDNEKIGMIVEFMERYNDIKIDLHSFIEDLVQHNQKLMQEAILKQKQAMHEEDRLEGQKSFWDDIGNTLGGVLGVVSVVVGVSMISSGTPLGILGGICLIASGLSSVGAIIAEKIGVKNDITLGLQIFGAILGLISGGMTILNAADKMSLLLKIGTALLGVAANGAQIISDVFTQKLYQKKAEMAAFDKAAELDQDTLSTLQKLLNKVSKEELNSEIQFVEALLKLKQLNEDVLNQNMRG